MPVTRALIASVLLKFGDEVDRRLRAEDFDTIHRPLLQGCREEDLIELLQGWTG